ncbi:uncharacterized protein KY384_003109 [Bacidia gigantensis]|uniref:uncharacterized protein n=1 Tax=Bacidia gigantensis TaxID=2732470 RepID=UPI001D046FE6|nr:uncharacterized protein KY384_003109 [Bacidia gigantensis]KAG8531480.1 hypothetical protein KY384_003109 [Bacidia gigantensis]
MTRLLLATTDSMTTKTSLKDGAPHNYTTPSFPSLYLIFGPKDVRRPQYLYNRGDIWRFTLYWTLIVFAAAHIAAGTYAVAVVWWGSREQRTRLGMGRKKGLGGPNRQGNTERQGVGDGAGGNREKVQAGIKGTGISGMWIVPALYALVAGVEGVLTGSVVGLL